MILSCRRPERLFAASLSAIRRAGRALWTPSYMADRQALADALSSMHPITHKSHAFQEARNALREAQQDEEIVWSDHEDEVISEVVTLADQVREDKRRAQSATVQILRIVEALPWRHRLMGNPPALVGLCLACVAYTIHIIARAVLDHGIGSLMRVLTVSCLITAIVLSRRGELLSYKSRIFSKWRQTRPYHVYDLPNQGDGVLPLYRAAIAGKWIGSIGISYEVGYLLVELCRILLGIVGYELSNDTDNFIREFEIRLFGTFLVFAVVGFNTSDGARNVYNVIRFIGSKLAGLVRRGLRRQRNTESSQ